MSKFRKKPAMIEASLWLRAGDHPKVSSPPHHCTAGSDMRCEHCGDASGKHGEIVTLESGDGFQIVCPGDWIITGIKGEVYPCKDEIFRMTYEPNRGANPMSDKAEMKPIVVCCPECGHGFDLDTKWLLREMAEHRLAPTPAQDAPRWYPFALKVVRQVYVNNSRLVIGNADELEAKELAMMIAAEVAALSAKPKERKLLKCARCGQSPESHANEGCHPFESESVPKPEASPRLPGVEEALVKAAIPLEAILAAVDWELSPIIMTAIKEAVQAIRAVLSAEPAEKGERP